MLKDKKGLSAIILTVIMIGLVLIAIGIVWVVVSNILTDQTEAIDYDQRCLGLNFDISAPVCVEGTCNVLIERALGSKGDSIDGVAVTLSNETESMDEETEAENIAATKTVSISSVTLIGSIKASVRIYFEKEDKTKHYCTQIFESEAAEVGGGAVF